LPDLWLVPAIAALALYGYAVIEPGRIKAALVNLVSQVLSCIAAGLLVYGVATATFAARVEEVRQQERDRIAGINAATAVEARLEATLIQADITAAAARLDEVMQTLPPEPAPDPAKPHGGGLSPASGAALLKIIGGN
jgi:hypothetical protein